MQNSTRNVLTKLQLKLSNRLKMELDHSTNKRSKKIMKRIVKLNQALGLM